MKTKQVTKLLAVVAFATSPAVADPTPRPAVTTVVAARPDPWAGTAPVTTPVVAPAAAAPVPAAVRALQSLVIELARPRVMPSGAPACGNVASRAPRPVSCNPEGSKP
jgi:hypothetical protein